MGRRGAEGGAGGGGGVEMGDGVHIKKKERFILFLSPVLKGYCPLSQCIPLSLTQRQNNRSPPDTFVVNCLSFKRYD